MRRWLLTLDASTPTTVVALGELDAPEPRASVASSDGANQTSEKLEGHVRHVLHECQITLEDVTAIAAGIGPGTFTGTRVTAAFAKGLAVGLGQGVHPISTLEALAWEVLEPSAGRREVLAMLDARRGEVYAATYAGSGASASLQLRCEARCATVEEIMGDANLPATAILVGTGVTAYEARLRADWPFELRPTDGLSTIGLWRAAQRAATLEAVDPADLAVRYLRASYAEMGIHKPKRPMIKSPFV